MIPCHPFGWRSKTSCFYRHPLEYQHTSFCQKNEDDHPDISRSCWWWCCAGWNHLRWLRCFYKNIPSLIWMQRCMVMGRTSTEPPPPLCTFSLWERQFAFAKLFWTYSICIDDDWYIQCTWGTTVPFRENETWWDMCICPNMDNRRDQTWIWKMPNVNLGVIDRSWLEWLEVSPQTLILCYSNGTSPQFWQPRALYGVITVIRGWHSSFW